MVAGAAYITSAAFIAAPATPIAKYGAFFSRPWELLPGALFALAALFFYKRYREQQKSDSEAFVYDYSLFLVALLNTACHLAALFSQRMFDGPFFIAELSKVAGYTRHADWGVGRPGAAFRSGAFAGNQRSSYWAWPITGG